MTVTELHEYFDLLTDKIGSAYFLESEKDTFLNRASLEFVKKTLPSSEGGIINIEFDQIVYSNIYTLVYETAGLTPSQGKVTKAQVQTALNTQSGSTDPFIYVMNVSWTKGGVIQPVMYVRQNEWYACEQNTFKKGKATRPNYKQDATGFTFSPVDPTASIKFTLLKMPRTISLSGDITSDLPESTHKTIVEMAVELASVGLRDQELQGLNSKQLDN